MCRSVEKLAVKRADKSILEWDPDYTKLTPEEKESLEKSDLEMKNGIYVSEDDVWE